MGACSPDDPRPDPRSDPGSNSVFWECGGFRDRDVGAVASVRVEDTGSPSVVLDIYDGSGRSAAVRMTRKQARWLAQALTAACVAPTP